MLTGGHTDNSLVAILPSNLKSQLIKYEFLTCEEISSSFSIFLNYSLIIKKKDFSEDPSAISDSGTVDF